MNNLLNIVQDQEEEVPIEHQQIIDYLQGQLKEAAQHQLEMDEQQDPLLQDAMDGLRMMEDKNRLEGITLTINQHLQQRIAAQKNRRKQTARWKDQSWIMMTVVLLLILIIVCFVVIRKMHS